MVKTYEELISDEHMAYEEYIEEHAAVHGWLNPSRMTEEDDEMLMYFRQVAKRYNISPGRATPLEYKFLMDVTEEEFYNQGKRLAV